MQIISMILSQLQLQLISKLISNNFWFSKDNIMKLLSQKYITDTLRFKVGSMADQTGPSLTYFV